MYISTLLQKIMKNELILLSVLQGFFESVSLLLRGLVEKRSVLENSDLVLLVLDAISRRRSNTETDSGVIANRVSMRGADSENSSHRAIFCPSWLPQHGNKFPVKPI